MKRLIAVVICAILLLVSLFAGYMIFVADVTMTAEFETYSMDIEEINVVWKNRTPRTFTWGEPFHIEKMVDGKWHKIPVETLFILIGYGLSPFSKREHTYNVKSYKDELEPGNYRIAASFLYTREPGDYDEYWAYAEFTIDDTGNAGV